jgi:AAA15 family ATPase/GTPase
MRIQSVYLENIKKFGSKGAIFNFAEHHSIHTVSGTNGSGKTAIFKAIQLFQKIFFFDQIKPDEFSNYEQLKQKIEEDINSLLSGSQAVIDIVFKDDVQKFGVKIIINIENNMPCYTIEDVGEQSKNELKKFWNIENPKKIVAFLDAGKSFSDFGVPVEKISLSSRQQKNRDFILDCIFSPEKTLQGIYRKTILDHIQYRLDPSRTLAYFNSAKIAIQKIAPNIEVKNISATKVDGHIVMLGKTYPEAQLFDVKDFSAGERALFLTLLFIFYLPNVGILIIDEPENHLHESLLRSFYEFLKKTLELGGTSAWLNEYSKDPKTKVTDQKIDDYLEQIFLTTHSKSLIYQNLNQGECLVMRKDSAHPLEDSSIERELRASGISTVFSRTLFVEGTSDTSLLTAMLENSGIKVMDVNNCKEVIDYFKKISKIRHKVFGAAFCFAIDNDNRTSADIESIRAIDPDFFDASFIVLEKHEMENYLIDKNLISDSLNPALTALSMTKIDEKTLIKTFKESAESLKDQSRSKYIASGLQIKIKNAILDPITNTRNIRAKNIEDLIQENFTTKSINEITEEGKSLEKYFNAAWDKEWENLVDGKAFLGKMLSLLSKECAHISDDVIKKNIIIKLQNEPHKYKAGKLIEDIIKRLDAQHII